MHKPVRNYRLILWWLTYRLPVEGEISPAVEYQAVQHARYRGGWEQWQEDKAKWSKQFARMLQKRQARREWLMRHGSVPDGWTPPLGDGQSNHRPIHLLKRRLPKSKRNFAEAELLC